MSSTPALGLLTALVCSIAIEAIQLVTALGTCQTADVVRNVAGAVVASGVGAFLLQVFAPTKSASEAELVGVDW